jgi:hypothetical protein
MVERILFPEWRDSNDTTRYPFSEQATLLNEEGTLLLEGTFLDAILYPIGGGAGLYITSAVIDHENVTLYIGNLTQPTLCSGTFPLLDAPDLIELVDAFGRPAGVLVSETIRLAIFQSWGTGTHEFSRTQTEFAATVCVPTPEIGVRGIQLDSGEVVVGDVWLVGDDGVVFRVEDLEVPATCERAAHTIKVIRMDVVGDPLFRRRLCEGSELFDVPKFIKTIRVVGPDGTFECTPDSHGNLQITANNDLATDTVLRITNKPEGVTIGTVGSRLTN